MVKPRLEVLLASPRGFCAGVVRAIDTVEAALAQFGSPIYVHHEIVHNPHVLADFRQRGVVFVDSAEEVPPGGRMIVSAHGAPPATFERAQQRGLRVVDGTCPLVTKVHHEVDHHVKHGNRVILIGQRGHAETIGTAGHGAGATVLVETVADAAAVPVEPDVHYAYAMQTTLSVDDAAAIVSVLEERIPDIIAPPHCDICYATTNRQAAIRAIAARCEGIVVVGGANSSNSRHLVEVARDAGCERTWFVSRGADVSANAFDGLRTLGISSGASTPANLVDELIEALDARFALKVETVTAAIEEEYYKLPSLSPFNEQPA